MPEENSPYKEIVMAAGSIIAISAVLGSHLEDPRFEAIQDAWKEKLDEVVARLDTIAEELTIFGEAYEGE